ncbi:MAG: ABC transporter ATP-binding protein [Myxococcales bacterium]|nr:ABC transporter ATP-binding protein [Myxococcales bacterium]
MSSWAPWSARSGGPDRPPAACSCCSSGASARAASSTRRICWPSCSASDPPGRRGPGRRLRRRARRGHPGGGGRGLPRRRRRVRRPRRRERLRQERHRPRPAGAARGRPHHRARDPGRRLRPRRGPGGPAAPARPRGGLRLPGSRPRPEPRPAGGRADRRAPAPPWRPGPPRRRPARRRLAGRGGHPRSRGPGAGLAAPALGRDAPARRGGHRPGLRPGPAHRRRAHDGPRRDHPGPDPGPHPRAPAGPGHGAAPHLPRPGRGGPDGRPGAGDVRRADRGGGARPRPLRRATPPVHPRPAAQRARAAGGRARRAPVRHPRHGAIAPRLPAQLPLPGPVRPRPRALRRGPRRPRRAGRAAGPLPLPRGGRAVTPLLEAVDLKVHFPVGRGRVVRAVDGVSLAVLPGETLGIVGESGSGKSTLGRALLRLEQPTGGQVRAFGDDVTTASERHLRAGLRRRAAMIFQDPHQSLNPRMRIAEAVAEPLVVHRVGDAAARRAAVAALLARVGLDPAVATRRPHAFSGGQLQRVGIARALALDPAVVVADEAVSALDVSVRAGVINLMLDLQAERGLAWVFIAHDLDVVRLVSHRVAVMYLGRVVELAPAAALFGDPRHPYTRSLLAAAPVPDPRRREAPVILPGEPPSPLDPPAGCAFHPRCPLAEARCREAAPPLRVGADGRAVACHLVDPEGIEPAPRT